MSANTRQIRPLTGVRGVAAIFVVIYHFSFVNSPFPRADNELLGRGYLAVDLFFLLSGMVMAMRQVSSMAAGSPASRYVFFIKSRIARIYPLYFVILIYLLLTAFVNYVFAQVPFPPLWSGAVILANLFLVQSWGALHSIGWVSWSLSAEMAAYVLFPVLFAIAFHRTRPIPYLLAVVCTMLLCIAAIHDPVNAEYCFGYLDVFQATDIRPVLRCVAGFTFGLLAYRVGQVRWVKRLISANMTFICVLIASVASFYLGFHDLIVYLGLFMLVLCCYGNSTASNAVFGNRVIHFLGVVSYSLYLVHPRFYRWVPVVAAWTRAHFGEYAALVYHALPFLPIIAVAYCLYRFVEVPGGRYTRKLLGLS